MAKKPILPDYTNLTVVPSEPRSVIRNVMQNETQTAPVQEVTSTLKARSKSVVLYLDPAGHRALKLYAVEAARPMQDLILEALEDWAKKKGITTPLRP